MSYEEQDIRDAFDSISMPAGLKQKTMQTIAERQRVQQAQTQPSKETSETASNPWAVPAEAVNAPAPERSLTVVRRNRRIRSFVAAAAACLVLAVVGIGGFSLYTTETAHVGIELNPSMELGLNRFDIVVSTQAYNEDAEEVLEETPLEGLPYEEAIEKLSTNELFMSKATSDAFMDISIYCDNQKQSQKLQNVSEGYIESLPCGGSCYGVTPELYEEAQSHHMGTARYQAALTLIELDSSLTIEDCMNMTMRELRNRIADAGGTVPEGSYGNQHHQGQGSSSSQGQGQGQGSGTGTGTGQGQGSSTSNQNQGTGQGQGATGQSLGQGQGTGQGAGQGQGVSGQGQGQSTVTQNHDTLSQNHNGSGQSQGDGYHYQNQHNQSQGTKNHDGYAYGHE